MITGALPRKNLQFDGLLPGHANTILRAVKVNDFKMICLRNPWMHCKWKTKTMVASGWSGRILSGTMP